MPRSVLVLIICSSVIVPFIVVSIFVVNRAKIDNGPVPVQQCVVGGCSGQLCVSPGSENDIATTCEYSELYGCYKEAICEPQRDGTCGWTQTQEFLQCQNNILQRQNNARQ